MNVEIGAEAAQFPEKEYINGIAVAVYRPVRRHRMDTDTVYLDWRACAATPLSGVSWL
jgi:hypothetical protein